MSALQWIIKETSLSTNIREDRLWKRWRWWNVPKKWRNSWSNWRKTWISQKERKLCSLSLWSLMKWCKRFICFQKYFMVMWLAVLIDRKATSTWWLWKMQIWQKLHWKCIIHSIWPTLGILYHLSVIFHSSLWSSHNKLESSILHRWWRSRAWTTR